MHDEPTHIVTDDAQSHKYGLLSSLNSSLVLLSQLEAVNSITGLPQRIRSNSLHMERQTGTLTLGILNSTTFSMFRRTWRSTARPLFLHTLNLPYLSMSQPRMLASRYLKSRWISQKMAWQLRS